MTRTADLTKSMLDAKSGTNDGAMSRAGGGERLDPALRPCQPFPVDVLPAPIGRFVRCVAGATGTDPSWAALAALTVVAGCVGNRAAVMLREGWVEPAILWTALVGKSGSIKSAVLRLVTRPLVELLKSEHDAFMGKMRAYEIELEQHSVALSKWKSEQKTGTSSNPPVAPEKPVERRVLISDVTVEKLAALLGENPLGFLVLHDELAGLINSFNRYAGGKGSDMQAWLSMNDGAPLIVDRKSDGSTFVERASVSLLGTIQPFTLNQVFGSVEREAGLLARVLLADPPDRPALWTEDELPEDVVVMWRELLAALLALVPAEDDAGRPRPRVISLACDAKKQFIAWHDGHAREVADLEDDHLRAHWSKLKGTCARIALLFSCIEAVGGTNVSAVSLDSIQRAIAVTNWFKRESARIYGRMRASDKVQALCKLVEWIERRGRAVTVRDVTHSLWMFRSKTEEARAALQQLVDAEVGRWVHTSPGPGGGRPAERFELLCASDITITETTHNDSASNGFGDGDGRDEVASGTSEAPIRTLSTGR